MFVDGTKARAGQRVWIQRTGTAHLTSESGGQGVRMDAECTGLWAWLKERKFSFKNFCAVKGFGGGEGKARMRYREDCREGDRDLARDTQRDVGGFVQGIPAPQAMRWQMISFGQ